MLTASQIMSSNLTTIRPEASIQEAIELLLDKGISGLPVTDAAGHLVGVITEYALLAIAYDHHVQNQTVEQHMTKDVITVAGEEPVNRVADLCIVHLPPWNVAPSAHIDIVKCFTIEPEKNRECPKMMVDSRSAITIMGA